MIKVAIKIQQESWYNNVQNRHTTTPMTENMSNMLWRLESSDTKPWLDLQQEKKKIKSDSAVRWKLEKILPQYVGCFNVHKLILEPESALTTFHVLVKILQVKRIQPCIPLRRMKQQQLGCSQSFQQRKSAIEKGEY